MKKLIAIAFSTAVLVSHSFSQNTPAEPNIEEQIDAILGEMSLEEKVGQTCQITLDVLLKRDSLGQPIEPTQLDPAKIEEAFLKYQVGSVLNVSWHTFSLAEWKHVFESVHAPYLNKQTRVPVLYGIDAIHGVNYTIGGTLFPQQIGLAATWNLELAKQFGNVTAYETRASGIPWNFSPVLDLGRQPLWSRHFETFGEDVLLASKMGAAVVEGYQGKGKIDNQHVAACLKHFVGYSNPMSGRDRTPAWIPDKYMKELYLPPFKNAVEDGALTLMINSGVMNGIPGHYNHHLLTEVLKKEWGFQGFTVSDWEDFIMLHTVHRSASTLKEAAVLAFNAGVDMSMVPMAPQYKEYCEMMIASVKDGAISMERLNDAVRRILRVKMQVGLYKENFGFASEYPDFGSEKHQAMALESALESITLLKNEALLPLKKSQSVLVAGPTADNLMFLNGAWSHTWQGDNPKFNTEGRTTIRGAFEQAIGKENCLYSPGAELYREDGYESSRLVQVDDFMNKASRAEVIVLCLGEMPSTEKPGDIRSLNLDEAQLDLAKMAYQTGKPVILVMVEGRPRIIREIEPKAKAIVQAYLPGDFGADALVKLLFGEANFSGKLPYTYPRYDGQIEFYDHPRSVDRAKSNDFNAYQPQWNFGHGMGYSKFIYSNLVINQTEIKQNQPIRVSVDVQNVGPMDSKEVVQLYVSDHFASTVPTGKSLKGFQKVFLAPGEKKTVHFMISYKDLLFVGQDGKWICEPGTFSIQIDELTKDFNFSR